MHSVKNYLSLFRGARKSLEESNQGIKELQNYLLLYVPYTCHTQVYISVTREFRIQGLHKNS